MNRKSFSIRTLGVAAAVAAVTLCSLNARAEMIDCGTPDTMGMAAWSHTTTAFEAASHSNSSPAHGFTSGPSTLAVESIILGLVDAGSPNTVANTVLLNWKASTAASGEQNKPLCDFTAAFPAPNTGSFIAPRQASIWELNLVEPQPSGLIGSDYGTEGMNRQENSNPGTHVTASQATTGAVEAIPQRSSPVMAGLGVGGIAMLARRRGRRQAQ
jgi:hypothetical protein